MNTVCGRCVGHWSHETMQRGHRDVRGSRRWPSRRTEERLRFFANSRHRPFPEGHGAMPHDSQHASATLVTTSVWSATATTISMSGTLDGPAAAMIASYLLDQAELTNGDVHLDLRAVVLVDDAGLVFVTSWVVVSPCEDISSTSRVPRSHARRLSDTDLLRFAGHSSTTTTTCRSANDHTLERPSSRRLYVGRDVMTMSERVLERANHQTRSSAHWCTVAEMDASMQGCTSERVAEGPGGLRAQHGGVAARCRGADGEGRTAGRCTRRRVGSRHARRRRRRVADGRLGEEPGRAPTRPRLARAHGGLPSRPRRPRRGRRDRLGLLHPPLRRRPPLRWSPRSGRRPGGTGRARGSSAGRLRPQSRRPRPPVAHRPSGVLHQGHRRRPRR